MLRLPLVAVRCPAPCGGVRRYGEALYMVLYMAVTSPSFQTSCAFSTRHSEARRSLECAETPGRSGRAGYLVL